MVSGANGRSAPKVLVAGVALATLFFFGLAIWDFSRGDYWQATFFGFFGLFGASSLFRGSWEPAVRPGAVVGLAGMGVVELVWATLHAWHHGPAVEVASIGGLGILLVAAGYGRAHSLNSFRALSREQILRHPHSTRVIATASLIALAVAGDFALLGVSAQTNGNANFFIAVLGYLAAAIATVIGFLLLVVAVRIGWMRRHKVSPWRQPALPRSTTSVRVMESKPNWRGP